MGTINGNNIRGRMSYAEIELPCGRNGDFPDKRIRGIFS